jgi:hypothetical protein
MEPGILAENPGDERDPVTGEALTAQIQAAFAEGGIAAACAVVKSGMTKEEIQAVCDGKASLANSTDWGIVFVDEELQPKAAKAKKAPEKPETHDYASERHKSEEHKKR